MNLRSNPPSIPFIDVAAQRRRLGSAIDTAVTRVLNHCQFIWARRLRRSRRSSRILRCPSCGHLRKRDRRSCACFARDGVGPGDAVLCPSFTFCATAEVAVLVGATPVFVDVDATTFNIDAKGIAGAIATAKEAGLKPKAIIPVDLFGLPADHSAIAAAAKPKIC